MHVCEYAYSKFMLTLSLLYDSINLLFINLLILLIFYSGENYPFLELVYICNWFFFYFLLGSYRQVANIVLDQFGGVHSFHDRFSFRGKWENPKLERNSKQARYRTWGELIIFKIFTILLTLNVSVSKLLEI